MPETAKGHKIMAAMQKEYGEKEGERVFYASRNKGTITGVDAFADKLQRLQDGIENLSRRFDSFSNRRTDAEQGWVQVPRAVWDKLEVGKSYMFNGRKGRVLEKKESGLGASSGKYSSGSPGVYVKWS